MKLQYLGDSKDSFKWDYHDYLTNALGYKVLNILLMMTHDDNTNEGNTKPDWFPARREIIQFCHELREERKLSRIISLPTKTGASYKVNLHKEENYFSKKNRNSYFFGLFASCDQVIFLDPDNGMEPEKRYNEKHVRYSELAIILEQITINSVISVFHHFRRINFRDDFARIKERILAIAPNTYVTAIFWHQVMFVVLGKSQKTIDNVRQINERYKETYPAVETIK